MASLFRVLVLGRISFGATIRKLACSARKVAKHLAGHVIAKAEVKAAVVVVVVLERALLGAWRAAQAGSHWRLRRGAGRRRRGVVGRGATSWLVRSKCSEQQVLLLRREDEVGREPMGSGWRHGNDIRAADS